MSKNLVQLCSTFINYLVLARVPGIAGHSANEPLLGGNRLYTQTFPNKNPSPPQKGGYPRGWYFWGTGSLRRARGRDGAPCRVWSGWLQRLRNAQITYTQTFCFIYDLQPELGSGLLSR